MFINDMVYSNIDRKFNYTFKELMDKLKCSEDELQDVLIFGMQAGVITGKMNEIQKFTAFREVIPLNYGNNDVVKSRLNNLKNNITKIRKEIQTQKIESTRED